MSDVVVEGLRERVGNEGYAALIEDAYSVNLISQTRWPDGWLGISNILTRLWWRKRGR